MSLVEHAERELEFAGVEHDVRPSLIAAVKAFASYGHSGGSHAVCVKILDDLLNYRALGPLTDSPDEWMLVEEFVGFRCWQNRRSSEAFSLDGGKTYYLLSEERRWLPWSLRRWLRLHDYDYVVFPRHRTEPAR